MILNDDRAFVLKRYTDRDYVGGPTIEVSGRSRDVFRICIGGDDYYAQEETLDFYQALKLHSLLGEWLERHEH